MSLTPGTRLGVYEVTAAIGKGGMGESLIICESMICDLSIFKIAGHE